MATVFSFAVVILSLLILAVVSAEQLPIPLKSRLVDPSQENEFNVHRFREAKAKGAERFMSSLGIVANDELHSAFSNSVLNSFDQDVMVLVQLDSEQTKQDVQEEWGVSLGPWFVGSNTYLTRIPLQKLAEEKPSSVSWIGHFDASLKSQMTLFSSPSRDESQVEYIVVLEGADLMEHTAAAASVNQILGHVKQGRAQFTVESERFGHIQCSGRACKQAIDAVSLLENVMWIELRAEKRLMNSFGHAIMQDGVHAGMYNTSIWERGIRGEGEVVTVLDTGLDWDNCFFANDNGQAPPMESVNMDLSKIVGYFRLAGDVVTNDPIMGHGTHVAGTVAGKISESHSNHEDLHPFNGMAPDAKMIIQGAENNQGGLSIPDDLAALLSNTRQQGSHIHTNSWGSNFTPLIDCQFDCQCVWGYAAAQFGLQPGAPVDDSICESDLGAPCCYVGAVYGATSSNIDEGLHDNDDMVMLFAAGNDGAQSSRSSISPQSSAKNVVAVGSSNNAHENFQNAHEYVDYASYANMLGYSSVSECCSDTQICCQSFWETRFNDQQRFQPESVSSFSSRGPTMDNRLRPDVVAPGHVIISAYSDGNTDSNNCGTMSPDDGNGAALVQMSGTSMATPGVAGAAALVREYFRKGFYPSGSGSSSDSMTPSGSLIKAVLVHSAQPISRTVNGAGSSVTVPSSSNRYAGHGLVTLSSALAFEDSDFTLFVSDDRSLENRDEDVWTVTLGESGELAATLTWYDPPANPASSQLVINRLDLGVGGEIDSAEDVTKKLLYSGEAGEEVEIRVRGPRVASGSQKYALVVTYGNGGEVEGPTRQQMPPDNGAASLTINSALLLLVITCAALVF